MLGLIIFLYIITSFPIYLLAVKANYKYPLFAFIPIFNIILILNIIGFSSWLILIILIPIVNIIFMLVISLLFFLNYESGLRVAIFAFVFYALPLMTPLNKLLIFIGISAIWWLALSDKKYIGKVYIKTQK